MDRKALFVGIQAEPGKEAEVDHFLRGALGPVEEEPDTRDWYALRFAPAQFAIFDTFADNAGRLRHLLGQVGRSLIAKTMTLLNDVPEIQPSNILAAKAPTGGRPAFCLHVPLKARDEREEEVAEFLVGAQPMVEAELGTVAWYALWIGGDSFAIIDFFADEAARDAHLAGQVAEALTAHAEELFALAPIIRRGEVLASKTQR